MNKDVAKGVGYGAGALIAAHFFPVTMIVIGIGCAGYFVVPSAVKAWRETH